MWDFTVEHVEGGGTVVGFANADKDASLVAARLASSLPLTVAFTRRLDLAVTRESDCGLVRDLGNAVVSAYSVVGAHNPAMVPGEGGRGAGGLWEEVREVLRVPRGHPDTVAAGAARGAHAAAMATATAAQAAKGLGNPLLNPSGTVVLGSVHRTTLYIAEALHAPVLPLAFISFARSWEAVASAPWTTMVGHDYGFDGLWLWNKITAREHLPEGYVAMLRGCSQVVVVRSTDADPVPATFGGAFVHSSLLSHAAKRTHTGDPVFPALSALVEAAEPGLVHLSPEEAKATGDGLRQWEWGVPDTTITMLRELWRALGKDPGSLVVVEAGTVALFGAAPRVWTAYLNKAERPPRGFTFSGYWVAHPGMERVAALVPFPFYCFAKPHEDFVWLRESARRVMDAVVDRAVDRAVEGGGTREAVCTALGSNSFVFTNGVGGGQKDVDALRCFLAEPGWHGANSLAHFSVGFDCPGATCVTYDDFVAHGGKAIGSPLPLPHRVALAVLLGLGPTGSFSALTLHDLLQAVGLD